MIRTHLFHCSLPRDQADALNRERGRIYTSTMVEHYRIYRQTGHWLSGNAGEKINDSLSETFLHAHSRDAAQEGFYKACQTATACRRAGLDVRYPHHLKAYRTTVWKNTAIRKSGEVLLLSLARGHAALQVELPSNLALLPAESLVEARSWWVISQRVSPSCFTKKQTNWVERSWISLFNPTTFTWFAAFHPR